MIDRRRLRRKLTFWRAAAFVVAAIAIVDLVQFLSAEPTAEQIEAVRICARRVSHVLGFRAAEPAEATG